MPAWRRAPGAAGGWLHPELLTKAGVALMTCIADTEEEAIRIAGPALQEHASAFKKVLEHLGLDVNRLIRISFGPFQLGELAEGAVEEIEVVFAVFHRPDKPQETYEPNGDPKLIKPEEKSTIEVIINAESLETRVAVCEDGRLEEFTIERTSDERLVGSIYKGKIRNLEDGLKAAFVDIGFEKNAFLHYWDIVPSNLDSGVEIVEREKKAKTGEKRADKPKVTQKDIPKLYPKGTELIIQVTKGPIGTKGPRVTTNIAIPGRYLVLMPALGRVGVSRKIEDDGVRRQLRDTMLDLEPPEGLGFIVRTAGQNQHVTGDISRNAAGIKGLRTEVVHGGPQPVSAPLGGVCCGA